MSEKIVIRDQSIDLIKILAMLGVISLHSNLGRTDTYITAFVLSRIAGISVPLFFMVSGYLMLERKTNWRYSVHKIIQILRFVFIIISCHWLLTICFTDYSFFRMLKTYIGSFIQRGTFNVFWYFGAMCIIYMTLPLLQRIYQHRNLWVYFIGFFGVVCFIFFELDAELAFEKKYVPQTFRIWYWFFFFMMGGVINRMNFTTFYTMKLLPVVLVGTAMIFLLFVYWFKYKINGIEYFFGSFLCWMYACVVFIYCLSKKVNHKFVIVVSKVFLPCYALHMLIIQCYRKFFDTIFLGIWSPIVDYLMVVFFTISLSVLIMHIPIVKGVFKI